MSTAAASFDSVEIPARSEATGRASAKTAAKKNPIPVRAMGFAFEGNVPRYWLFGNPVATHVSNALNSLFPAGERFFIRSVKHYMSDIEKDPELLKRVRGFFGQEGRHGHEHTRWNRILEEQGYEIEEFLAEQEKLMYGEIEPRMPPALRLAVTAALEHFTATMAHNGLGSDFLDHADPTMAALLRWHAAEEIEHKSVAFDVFEKVDGRYSVRALGLGIALLGLLANWRAATAHLLKQEAKRGTDIEAWKTWARENPRMQAEEQRRHRMFRDAIVEYLRPDFHPDQRDDYALARGYLESVGRADG
jgi:predicted metal-dependent hydrolase